MEEALVEAENEGEASEEIEGFEEENTYVNSSPKKTYAV